MGTNRHKNTFPGRVAGKVRSPAPTGPSSAEAPDASMIAWGTITGMPGRAAHVSPACAAGVAPTSMSGSCRVTTAATHPCGGRLRYSD